MQQWVPPVQQQQQHILRLATSALVAFKPLDPQGLQSAIPPAHLCGCLTRKLTRLQSHVFHLALHCLV